MTDEESTNLQSTKRYLFYCNSCGFEYSSSSEEHCSCSFCGTVNNNCYINKINEEYGEK